MTLCCVESLMHLTAIAVLFHKQAIRGLQFFRGTY